MPSGLQAPFAQLLLGISAPSTFSVMRRGGERGRSPLPPRPWPQQGGDYSRNLAIPHGTIRPPLDIRLETQQVRGQTLVVGCVLVTPAGCPGGAQYL